jgi:hypothetical protein
MRKFIVGIIVVGVMLLPGCFGDRGRVVEMGRMWELQLSPQGPDDSYEPVG